MSQSTKLIPRTLLTRKRLSSFRSRIAEGAPDECWQWTGAVNSKGYGVIVDGVDRRHVKARRLAYLVAHTDWNQTGEVRVTCGNRLCMNPAHMVLK